MNRENISITDICYCALLRKILEKGILKKNRTGVDTLSIFGYNTSFDLTKGFPLLTTKKIYTKGMVHELLWFLRGETNIKYLVDNDTHIWDAWANENGDLNNVYGAQWVRWEGSSDNVIKVERRQKEDDSDFIYFREQEKVDSTNSDIFCGNVYKSRSGEEFKVLSKITGKRNSYYKVQFLSNGYITEVSRPNLKRGMVENKYSLNILGVACLGKCNKNYNKSLYNLWYNMIARCYNPNHPSYPLYGGKGVTVSRNWKCFEKFKEEITQIPFYNSWKKDTKGFNLDKDYYGANQYSKTTCIFLDTKYNKDISRENKAFKYKDILFVSQKDCSNRFGIDSRRISEKINNIRETKLTKDIVLLPSDDNILYRKERVVNQIEKCVDLLKKDPDNRRILVSAWNVKDLPEMALAPCHYSFQFYSHENNGNRYLSLLWNQRSVDTFLGLPFNIASYALLCHMMAQVTGHIPYRVIFNGGDTHLYVNHIEQAKEQLLRDPTKYEPPTLKLNPDIKNIFDFKYEDIVFENYESYPAIKAPIAV